MEGKRRVFVSADGLSWQFEVEHRVQGDSLEWRAYVWEGEESRGFLEGRVLDPHDGDPESVCSVAVKLRLDTPYQRNFSQPELQSAVESPDSESSKAAFPGADLLAAPA